MMIGAKAFDNKKRYCAHFCQSCQLSKVKMADHIEIYGGKTKEQDIISYSELNKNIILIIFANF